MTNDELVAWLRMYAKLPGLNENTDRLAIAARRLEAAGRMADELAEIAKAEGRFSRDILTHATNTIEDMKAKAEAALAAWRETL